MLQRLPRLVFCLVTASAIASCSGSDGSQGPTGPAGPQGTEGDPGDQGDQGDPGDCASAREVLIPGPSFFPEGIAQDAAGTLYIGSIGEERIVRFERCDLFPTTFVDDLGMSVFGLTVDDVEGVLFACLNDVLDGVAATRILGFDLDDGSVAASHLFPGGGFCNDLVQDADGNLYATDSDGRIIRVAVADLFTDDQAQAWIDDEEDLEGDDEIGFGIGANGIVADSSGDLYVTNFDQGLLLHIEVLSSGLPGELTVLSDELFAPDGLAVVDDDTLLVVEVFGGGDTGTLTEIALDAEGDVDALTFLATGFDFPTTVVVDGNGAWVVEGQLLDFFLEIFLQDLPFRVLRLPLPF
jgi:sugar lactone lactonase YvrE